MNNNTWDAFDLDRTVRDFDFTRKAVRRINSVVYSAEFEDMDSVAIFRYLSEEMELVSFKDYLKRYIYERAQMEEPFSMVTDDVYKEILASSFSENNAPHSFEPTSKKWGAIIKSWLTQENVKRSTVFLLGFGMRMDPEDVSEFLTKVLKEEDIRRSDPEEVVYWYCYKNNLPYAKARQILEMIAQDSSEAGRMPEEAKEKPEGFLKKLMSFGSKTKKTEKQKSISAQEMMLDRSLRNTKRSDSSCEILSREIRSEEDLLDYLWNLNELGLQDDQTEIAYAEFERLMGKAKEIIAGIYQEDTLEEGGNRIWKAEDITAGDLERMICSGIPITGNGNLQKMSASLLAKHFRQKRLSRQRIDSVMKRELAVDRFDLITLLFFLCSQEQEDIEPEIRCRSFIDEINAILKRCGMLELYPVNPYEAFILMCLLSESPLGTYAEIWEMSYEAG